MGTATADIVTDRQWLHTWRDQQIDAWNSHDPDEIVARMSADIVRVDPALAGPVVGKDAVRQTISELLDAFPDMQVSFLSDLAISPDGRTVYGMLHVEATNHGTIKPEGIPATRRSAALTGVWVGEFRDGLLWHDSIYYDTCDLNRQLGLMPARGSRAEQLMIKSHQLRGRLRGLRRRLPR